VNSVRYHAHVILTANIVLAMFILEPEDNSCPSFAQSGARSEGIAVMDSRR